MEHTEPQWFDVTCYVKDAVNAWKTQQIQTILQNNTIENLHGLRTVRLSSKVKHTIFFSWRYSMYVVPTPSNAHNTYQHDGSTKVFRIGQWQLIQCLVVRVINKVTIIVNAAINVTRELKSNTALLHYKYLIHQHKKLHIKHRHPWDRPSCTS